MSNKREIFKENNLKNLRQIFDANFKNSLSLNQIRLGDVKVATVLSYGEFA